MDKFTKEQALVITGFTGISACNFGDFQLDVEKMTGDYKILLSNMRCNNWTHVIKTKAGNFQPYKYDIDQIV